MIDSRRPDDSSRFVSFARSLIGTPHIDVTKPISGYTIVGLSLLYASAYFLQPLSEAGAYFLPSRDFLRLIALPTLIAVFISSALMYGVATVARRWFAPHVVAIGVIAVMSVLTLIALKGVMVAAGYDWQDRLFHGSDMVVNLRRLKIMAFFAVCALIWTMRSLLPKVSRLLSSLGFAFGALATVRLFMLSHEVQPTPVPPSVTGQSGLQLIREGSRPQPEVQPSSVGRPRRVIWILFDETDFSRLYGNERIPELNPVNFNRLAHAAVFATNANSPASATVFSIPALLTGTPIGGDGIRIDKSASLALESLDSKLVPFNQTTSIFGALAADGLGASVLGFYHPYCKIFTLQRCNAFAWPEYGGLDAALWANIPDGLVARVKGAGSMQAITRDSLRLLPQYLQRDDALTFVHLNIPHLPADYAAKALNLPASSSPLVAYSQNLMFTDRILGQIIDAVERQSSSHELLLVVSTDHWFRNSWYQAEVPEKSRPIPFIAWKVGDSNGIVVSHPLSTVHTAAMISDYLHGKITTQTEIAAWWDNQAVYPSFIVPST